MITGRKELMIRTTIKSFFGCYYFVKSIRNRKKGIYDMNNHKIYFLGCYFFKIFKTMGKKE